MKMTMDIDEAVLARVVSAYGFDSKTAAVEAALLEMDRRSALRKFAEEGLGVSAEELRDAVDPDYDPMALRVAEAPTPYGTARSR